MVQRSSAVSWEAGMVVGGSWSQIALPHSRQAREERSSSNASPLVVRSPAREGRISSFGCSSKGASSD
eukprot:749755-Hanusia_phi.AAC.3